MLKQLGKEQKNTFFILLSKNQRKELIRIFSEFLVKTDYDKFLLFNLIKRPISIQNLAKEIKVTRSPLKIRIEELKSDIQTTGLDVSIITKEKSGLVFLAGKRNDIKKCERALRIQFFKASTLFQLFEFLLISPKTSIYELANKFSLSESYLYVEMRKINRLISKYDLSIKVDKKEISLNANSLKRQYHLIYIYVQIYDLETWPNWLIEKEIARKALDPRIVRSFEKTNRKMIEQITFVYAVQIYFIEMQKKVFDFNEEVRKITRKYMDINDFSEYNPSLVSFYKLSEQEMITLNLLIRFLFFDSENYEFKIKIGQSLWLNESIVEPISQLVKYFYQVEERSNEFLYILMYSLSLFFVGYQVLGFDFLADNKFFNLREEEKFVNISAKFQRIHSKIKNVINLKPEMKSLENVSTSLACIIFMFDNTSIPVRIAIRLFQQSPYAEVFVKKKLRTIFSANVLFTDQIENADLMITDSEFTETQSRSDYFFIDSIFSSYEWENLIIMIQKIIQEKSTDCY